jgi:hypothetical protein
MRITRTRSPYFSPNSATAPERRAAVFAWQRRLARAIGERPERAHSNGAISFVQRFDSSLALNVHYHALIPDGVFVRDGDDPDVRPRFVEIDPPADEDVAGLLDRIIERVVALLRRRGRLHDDDASDDQAQAHLVLATSPAKGDGHTFVEEPLPSLCARKDGFSLHAGVAVHANDRLGLERLCRYGLRPPLAQGRLAESSDGTLLYMLSPARSK